MGMVVSTVTRLTTSNYITWSLQVSLFLYGHNLLQHITNDATISAPTIQVSNLTTPNPKYTAWHRQDKLIFSALLGSISTPFQPIISTATTTLQAWNTLRSNFGRPFRGHMKQIKEQHKKSSKGQRTIDEYMQSVRAKADQLTLFGKPLDHEDIIEYILDGLDDDYRGVVEHINGREVPPTLEELHDKLVNREASHFCLQLTQTFPMTANVVFNKSKSTPRPQQSYDDRQPSHNFGPCNFSNQ